MQQKGPTTNDNPSYHKEKSTEQDKDVLLEVPQLKVNEIKMKVEDLNAKISLKANISKLVNIEVGADIALEKVDIELKGVEAEAYLKVKLDRVQQILNKALESIDTNPEILKEVQKAASEASMLEEKEAQKRNIFQKISGSVGDAIGSAGDKLSKDKPDQEGETDENTQE